MKSKVQQTHSPTLPFGMKMCPAPKGSGGDREEGGREVPGPSAEAAGASPHRTLRLALSG